MKPERRASPRFGCALPVEVLVHGDGGLRRIEATHLCDVSGGGARLISARPEAYEVGMPVELRIHRPDGQPVLECPADVVWIGDEADGRASVSLAMRYLFDDAALRSMVGETP